MPAGITALAVSLISFRKIIWGHCKKVTAVLFLLFLYFYGVRFFLKLIWFREFIRCQIFQKCFYCKKTWVQFFSLYFAMPQTESYCEASMKDLFAEKSWTVFVKSSFICLLNMPQSKNAVKVLIIFLRHCRVALGILAKFHF